MFTRDSVLHQFSPGRFISTFRLASWTGHVNHGNDSIRHGTPSWMERS